MWGMAGYGEGTLTLTPEGQAPMRPDMDLAMGALGVRGVLVDGGTEGPTLAAKSDAFAVRTSTDAVTGLAGSEADVTRVRLALEGSQPFNLGGDAVLTPSLELGVRHDGGDAETGFGADIGAGLILAAPSRGLSAELRARGLLTHKADGLRERGVSGMLSFDPAPDSDRGALAQPLADGGRAGRRRCGRAACAPDPCRTRRGRGRGGARPAPRCAARLRAGRVRRRLDGDAGVWARALRHRPRPSPSARASPSGWRWGSPSSSGWRPRGARSWTAPRTLGTGSGWVSAGSSRASARAMRRSRCASMWRAFEAANDDPPENRIGLKLTARW